MDRKVRRWLMALLMAVACVTVPGKAVVAGALIPSDEALKAPDGVRLLVLAIGINRYPGVGLNFEFCEADAKSMAASLAEHKGNLFTEVVTKVLLTDQATRTGVLGAFQELSPEMSTNDAGSDSLFVDTTRFPRAAAGHGSSRSSSFIPATP